MNHPAGMILNISWRSSEAKKTRIVQSGFTQITAKVMKIQQILTSTRNMFFSNKLQLNKNS